MPKAFARALSRICGGTDAVVVSGLAQGIDSFCHMQAIRSHIPTVAVIAQGIEADIGGSRNHRTANSARRRSHPFRIPRKDSIPKIHVSRKEPHHRRALQKRDAHREQGIRRRNADRSIRPRAQATGSCVRETFLRVFQRDRTAASPKEKRFPSGDRKIFRIFAERNGCPIRHRKICFGQESGSKTTRGHFSEMRALPTPWKRSGKIRAFRFRDF